MDVEHYRPKAKVANEPTHKGYWWLAYDWDNYLWSCKSCNEAFKKNQFPLLPSGVRAAAEDDDLDLEKPCLINPRFDEPTEYFAYYKKKLGGRWFVRVIPLPDLDGDGWRRADESIEILGLNRTEEGDDLVSERGASLSPHFENIAYSLKLAINGAEISADIDMAKFYEEKIVKLRNQLKPYIQSGREYSGFFRYFLSDMAIDYSDLI